MFLLKANFSIFSLPDQKEITHGRVKKYVDQSQGFYLLQAKGIPG